MMILAVFSPPLCGAETSEARSQGSGVGVSRMQCLWLTPLPNPPPQGGGKNAQSIVIDRIHEKTTCNIAPVISAYNQLQNTIGWETQWQS